MAVTFIDYKNNKGFYIVEDAMELAFQYIYKELKKEEDYTFSDKKNLLYDALSNINGFSRGYLVLMWHEYIHGLEEEQEMVRLLESIINQIQIKGSHISVEELQSMPSESEDWRDTWNSPFPTKELIKVYAALISMLKGEWESTNFDMKIDWD